MQASFRTDWLKLSQNFFTQRKKQKLNIKYEIWLSPQTKTGSFAEENKTKGEKMNQY